jgi:crotonobetainyl-CoA:carnitine CoA-transferase CaiB-like acyl-CoA transferase
LLADLGADVVLVEPPDGDALRRAPPFKDGAVGPDASLSFAYYNSNKRGVTLDKSSPRCNAALRTLGATADVIFISPSPRSPILGFDERARSLSWTARNAILCSITPFGLTGPYRDRRSTPFISYAVSGDMHRVGPPDGPPVAMPGRQLWDEAGIRAAICVMVALRARPVVGGQTIDLSVHEVACSQDFLLEQYRVEGMPVAGRFVTVGLPPTGTWMCSDGPIEVAAHQLHHWDAFLETLDHPEELAAPALQDPMIRREIFDGITETIERAFLTRGRHATVDKGQAAGLPCSVLNSPAEFVTEEQLAARDFFATVHHDVLGDMRMPGRAVKSSTAMFRPGRAAPRLGEHNQTLLADEPGTTSLVSQVRTVDDPGSDHDGLAGVKVLSFGAFIAGNVSALILAEFGADVVKIEARARPEVLRMPVYGFGASAVEPSGVPNTSMYAGFSRNARSLSLDMLTAEGRDLFRRLVVAADVVIENFGVGTMENWGCGFDDLIEINPKLVMLSLSGYGRTGPRATHRAYATNISSFVGLTATWNHSHGAHTDYVCAAHGALAIIAALEQVKRTGPGVFIDAAQIETIAAVMAPILLEPLVNGRDVGPPGNDVPGSLLAGVFRCAGHDRWVALELEDVADWSALCALLNSMDLNVSTTDEAKVRRGALTERVASWARERSPHTAALILQQSGLAAGPVQDMEDIVRDPVLRERDFVVEIDQPDLGPVEYTESPHRLSRTPGRWRRPGPRLGQHTDEILREWLGLTDPQIDALGDAGAVFGAPLALGSAADPLEHG